MRGAQHTSWAAVLVCLASVGALRCNAVLGIETAELDPTVGASGTGGSGTGGTAGTSGTSGTSTSRGAVNVPYPGCIDATDACARCIGTCPGFDLGLCLANKVCRESLDAYRGCLGSTCTGNGVDCVEDTLFGTNEPLVDALVPCVNQTCGTDCAGSPLVTMCELYCACMKDNCGSKPIATDPNCVATCKTGATMDGTIAHCRKHHCEYIDVAGAIGDHCDHAIGVDQCLDPVDPNQECVFPDGIIRGFPCQVGGPPCCNGICGPGQTCE